MDPASSVSLCTSTVVHYNIAACVNVCMPRGGNSRGRARGGAETWHSRVTLSCGENQMNRLRRTGHAAVVHRADYSSGATAWWSHRHRRKTAPEAWSCTAELRTHPPQPVSHQPATEQELMATMAAAIREVRQTHRRPSHPAGHQRHAPPPLRLPDSPPPPPVAAL